MLLVSGAMGDITACNIDGEVIWSKKSQGTGGWMVRADPRHLYHGTGYGVTKYELRSGELQAVAPTKGPVLFGVIDNSNGLLGFFLSLRGQFIAPLARL